MAGDPRGRSDLRFGIVGFGGSGQATARRLARLPGVRVAAILDPKPPGAMRIRLPAPAGATFHQDRDGFLATELDAVAICSPDHTHLEYALAALARERSVLVEKPMVVGIEECRRLAAAVVQSGAMVGVHHQKRYLPAFREARRRVAAGEIGDVIHVEVDYIHDMRQRAVAYDAWRLDPQHPQEVALGLSSHSFDLVRWVSGREATRVLALETAGGWPEYPTADTSVALLELAGGATARVTSTIASRGPQIERLVVYGSGGQIRNNLVFAGDGRARLTARIRDGLRPHERLVGRLLPTRRLQEFPYSVNQHEIACRHLLRDFVAALRASRPFAIDHREGAEAVRLCIAAMRAARTGTAVDLDGRGPVRA